jgi:hypothetical protein
MNIRPRLTLHGVWQHQGGTNIDDIIVITDRSQVKILGLDSINACLKLFDTDDWSYISELTLGVDSRGLAGHGDRTWVTSYDPSEVYEIRFSPGLAVSKIFPVREYGYEHLAYVDCERLVAVSPSGPAVHVLSHNFHLLLDMTS